MADTADWIHPLWGTAPDTCETSAESIERQWNQKHETRNLQFYTSQIGFQAACLSNIGHDYSQMHQASETHRNPMSILHVKVLHHYYTYMVRFLRLLLPNEASFKLRYHLSVASLQKRGGTLSYTSNELTLWHLLKPPFRSSARCCWEALVLWVFSRGFCLPQNGHEKTREHVHLNWWISV